MINILLQGGLSMVFKKQKYQIIRNVISKELTEFCYQYLKLRRIALHHMLTKKLISVYDCSFGSFGDSMIPECYCIYGDPCMETLLIGMQKNVEKITALNLVPTYAYARIYKQGNLMRKHKDRLSCEISTTLNLGGTLWPIYLEGKAIKLNPGDMLVYRGCELEHWRNKLKKGECAQVFLHYNKDTKKAIKFDNRAALGVPKYGNG